MPDVKISQSQSQTVRGDPFPNKSPVVENYESDMKHQPLYIRVVAERERTEEGKEKAKPKRYTIEPEKSKRNSSPLKQKETLTD